MSVEKKNPPAIPQASLEMEVKENTEAFPSFFLRSLGGSSDDDKVARQRREAAADAEWQATMWPEDVPDAAETLMKMDDEDREGWSMTIAKKILLAAASKKEAADAEWQAAAERVG